GRLLLQVNVVPLMGALALSNADAVNATLPPTGIEVLAGATVTLATTAAGGGSGLQAPKLEGPADHTPAEFRCSELPIGVLVLLSCATMLVGTRPTAGPAVGTTTPS